MWFKSVMVYDLETKTSWIGEENNIRDNSPRNPDNFVVGIYWKVLRDITDPILTKVDLAAPVNRHVIRHNDKPDPDDPSAFIDALKSVDCTAAHNNKFDTGWLVEMGLEIPELCYCTMIAEYIFARGNPIDKSLKGTAERRDVTRKKSDLIDAEFKSGKEFSEIDLVKVNEYAEADVQSCAEILVQQLQELSEPHNVGLTETFKLMNEMLLFLVEIEKNGIKIDMDALEKVGSDYREEKTSILNRLNEIVVEVMGDTPINLASGPDLVRVVFSRIVIDKVLWKATFNLGTDSNGKALYPTRMKPTQFNKKVREMTTVAKRQTAVHCHDCAGSGYIQKMKKDGSPYKNKSPCPRCKKEGALYLDGDKVAGLKMIPSGTSDVSVHGFKTDKATLASLIDQAKDKGNLVAQEFLEKITRLNAVNTYLDSFVTGIRTYTRKSGFLHANFNQTITRTGRLSSSQPNFQNLPKGNKFPVRKAVVSRFENGFWTEYDYSGLEFRVAGELSQDSQIIEDVVTGKDVHKQTASIIYQEPESDISKEKRQNSKAYTFAPLYGGRGANEKPHIRRYFDEYFVLYRGLSDWHQELFTGVLGDGIVRVPSGREYKFHNVRRIGGGRVSNATNIVNYPVQGWATGCLVPLACIRALRKFKELGLKSKLTLTVHDSICCDVHPEERLQVQDALKWAMVGVVEEAKERWNYSFSLPLDIEGSEGKNWMEQEDIPLTNVH
jgi:DNA polymerase I-like protein with 3'-5' exonuclease and polymerase domains